MVEILHIQKESKKLCIQEVNLLLGLQKNLKMWLIHLVTTFKELGAKCKAQNLFH